MLESFRETVKKAIIWRDDCVALGTTAESAVRAIIDFNEAALRVKNFPTATDVVKVVRCGGGMMPAVYMKVTGDELELPIAVADSAEELAKMVGVDKRTIWSQISRGSKIKTGKQRHFKIYVKEDETR